MRNLFVLALVVSLNAHVAVAAESADYKPSNGMYVMEAHLQWCGEAKSAAVRLKRYEKFWEMQHPNDEDGYDDDRHVRMVRCCAYRMAQLYAETGRGKDCLRMLKWLEKEDARFEIERQQQE